LLDRLRHERRQHGHVQLLALLGCVRRVGDHRCRLHADAVHVCLQRHLQGSLRPLQRAQPLHVPHLLRRSPGQRTPAHDPECEARSCRHGHHCRHARERRTHGHCHRDCIRATGLPGPHGRRHPVRACRPQRAICQLIVERLERSRRRNHHRGASMSDFLHALKADLLDRRLLPFVVLLTAALVGVLAYVLLGGRSGAEGPPPLSVAQTGSGIALSAQTPVDKSAAETVSGSPRQRAGLSRNPFVPLAGTTTTTTTTTRSSSAISTSTSKSTPSSSSGSSSEASPSAGGASPAPAAPKKTRPKRHKQYRVAILMGAASAGTLPQNANLTPYKKLKLHQQLPSPGLPLVAFTGVTKSGKSAVFKLVGEVILRAPAACLPSASQCEAIALKVGQTEELEYLHPGGTPV